MKTYLSYLAGDVMGWQQILTDQLHKRFGEQSVVDGGALDPTTPADKVVAQVLECDAVLAIIGPGWQQDWTAADAPAALGLIRQQLATAFQHRLRVLAVRVGDTEMPDERQLPEDMQRLTLLQTPELTSANQRVLIKELCLGLDPDRPKRRRRRLLDVSLSVLATGLVTVVVAKLYLSSAPQFSDELWLKLLIPIELGSPNTRYFKRTYESMPVRSNNKDERWDAIELGKDPRVSPWAKQFSCAAESDMATFVYKANRLTRVSYRFCDSPNPCQQRLFAIFAALAGASPVAKGGEMHFEARGKDIDVLGWSGPGLTAIDVVTRGPREGNEEWFSFLRDTVVKNQCKHRVSDARSQLEALGPDEQ